MQIKDTYRHKGMRKKLVETLFEEGINDETVLAAIGNVPRHYFMDSAFLDFAYQNNAFPIGKGQTISQPYTVAFQTSLLDLQPSDRVLEIGTGSGYQASVLGELNVQVFTIERHKSLHLKAKKLLAQLGYNKVRCFYGDGYEGLPKLAPFDKILITAAAPEIPQKLIEQLKTGGILVIPFGEGETQEMLRLTKTKKGILKKEAFDAFSFVPMLKGTK